MSRMRQNINIELAEGCKDALELVRSWNGMTQKELVGRLIGWFCEQDRVVQQVILGQIPEEIAPEVAEIILKKMQSGKKSNSTFGGRLASGGYSDELAAAPAAVGSPAIGEIADE
ncbi:MAG: hypothetical protein JJU36_16280 [Phycisphaeraceae bacterium]|nr:hypothetical protein [Phycisphaeraceae bacterium]